jgi:hypothetical protein
VLYCHGTILKVKRGGEERGNPGRGEKKGVFMIQLLELNSQEGEGGRDSQPLKSYQSHQI